MDHDQFLTIVQQRTGIGREMAERAARATLETLAERIAAGEARDLAGELPPDLAPWLYTTSDAEGFDLDEFVARVARREETDPETAERHARAVFAALAQAVSPRELSDMLAELPAQYSPLLPGGPPVAVLSSAAFLQRVADRAGLDDETARRATDAVLETLAERIAGGEVDDLVPRLPLAVHEPLKRGRAHTGGKAARMSLEEFLERVAAREDATVDAARDHARAVFTTLREAVGDDEFFDVASELPDEYKAALAR